MITSTRQELLQVIAEISEFVPEVRLGQLIANLSCLAPGPFAGSVWDVEDEEMLEGARQHLEHWRARSNPLAPPAVDIDTNAASLPQVPSP
jgi:hypothetical protein